jgi:hypothetical protein
LVDGSSSASTLSKELGVGLGLVSYHLNQVLAKECEVVELVKEVPRRGAMEKFYRLKFQVLSEGDLAPGPRTMSLEECFIVAVAAMEAGVFEALDGSSWDWFLAQVDSRGWAEVSAAKEDFDSRVRAAVDATRARSGEADIREVVVGAAAFPAVPPAPTA